MERLNDTPPEERKPVKETSGEYLWKRLRPAGCVLVLMLMAAMLAVCFASGREPIEGYTPPQTTEYYAAHPEELVTELETNVFPALDAEISAEAGDGTVTVTIESASFASARGAILRYFDKSLFEFVQGE
ncbi:MAG: hypothetical protein LUG92_02120 [Oscillospiraceae bacterium]|nr:hypothetical protein [Oscillospiraceae bacterium]